MSYGWLNLHVNCMLMRLFMLILRRCSIPPVLQLHRLACDLFNFSAILCVHDADCAKGCAHRAPERCMYMQAICEHAMLHLRGDRVPSAANACLPAGKCLCHFARSAPRGCAPRHCRKDHLPLIICNEPYAPWRSEMLFRRPACRCCGAFAPWTVGCPVPATNVVATPVAADVHAPTPHRCFVALTLGMWTPAWWKKLQA